ncbi:hypothetical protein, partial [Aeromonas enteropelogenes]|uniref:hypothetical protein n=1 Tax=Aeromonas enteropelogenes TaxID=29489 RepID=UPI003BA22695
HAETALGTGRMTSTFECSKKWGDYRLTSHPFSPHFLHPGRCPLPHPVVSPFAQPWQPVFLTDFIASVHE